MSVSFLPSHIPSDRIAARRFALIFKEIFRSIAHAQLAATQTPEQMS
jgi:hypothetical protein